MLRIAAPLIVSSLLVAQDAGSDATDRRATDQETADRHAKLDLDVLYVGAPEHPRTTAWRDFLAPRTAGFRVVDAESFAEADAAGADVVVLDCPDPIVRDENGRPTRIAVPQPKQLTASFATPTVVVGGMALVTDRLQLKPDWL